MISVEAVLADPDDVCHAWIDATHGRAVRVDSFDHGSASIWSRRTDSGVAVLTSAAHVMSPCWRIVSELEDAGVEPMCAPTLYDPADTVGQATIRIAERGGGPAASQWSAHFSLFNPVFPVEDAAAMALVPRHDWSVYVVDSQLFAAFSGQPEIIPDPILDSPPAFYDPLALTDAEVSWATPTPGRRVLVVGFPVHDGNADGRLLQASVGTVLADDDAHEAIALLAAVGDAEGDIAYDPGAEFLFEGHALPGMSGSGVYDENGIQVGIVVRASFSDTTAQYLRAVRMSHVAELIASHFAAQSSEAQAQIGRFLPPLYAAGN